MLVRVCVYAHHCDHSHLKNVKDLPFGDSATVMHNIVPGSVCVCVCAFNSE